MILRGVLSYTPAGRVVLVEYTLQEEFQTEAAVLAWAQEYPQIELPAHLNAVLHYVRDSPSRGLLRPLWGPRAGVMLFGRVQRRQIPALVESVPARGSTNDSKSQRGSDSKEDQPTSDHTKQLRPKESSRQSVGEKRRSPGPVSGENNSDRGTSGDSDRHSRLTRSPCLSNVCYHTPSSSSIRCGDDQCPINVDDIGKQSKLDFSGRVRPVDLPSIISRGAPPKKKQKVSGEGTRVSTLDRFSDELPTARYTKLTESGIESTLGNCKCISCGRIFVGPPNYKWCPVCYQPRDSLC